MALELIDVSGILHRYFHIFSSMRRASDDAPIGAVYGCCHVFWGIAKRKPGFVAAVYDGRRSRATRQAIFPDYKCNRPPINPELSKQFDMARAAATAFGFAVLEHDESEADDIMATCARIAKLNDVDVIIASSDKDLAQLIDDNTVLYDPVEKRTYRNDDVVAKWGVRPDQMLDYLALMGDASDNIPGVPRVGAKTAAKLLQAYGDIEGVLANTEKVTQGAVRESLRLNGWQARISKRLAALNAHVPLEHGIENMIYEGPPMDKIISFMCECGLEGLAREFEREASMMVEFA